MAGAAEITDTTTSAGDGRYVAQRVLVAVTAGALAVMAIVVAGADIATVVFGAGVVWLVTFLGSVWWIRPEVSGAALTAVCLGLAVVATTDGDWSSTRPNWGFEVSGSAFLAVGCLGLWALVTMGHFAVGFRAVRVIEHADERATARQALARRAVGVVLLAALVVVALAVAWSLADWRSAFD